MNNFRWWDRDEETNHNDTYAICMEDKGGEQTSTNAHRENVFNYISFVIRPRNTQVKLNAYIVWQLIALIVSF